MKISFLKPWKKKPREDKINPFEHNMTLMGERVGGGRVFVMYQSHDNYREIQIVDTETGQRLEVKLPETEKKPIITVYETVVGWKAALMVFRDGEWDCEQTGIFAYEDPKRAVASAKEWAKDEELKFVLPDSLKEVVCG